MFKISKYCIPIENEGQMIVFNTMTSCLFASMNKSDNRKFRYADICSCECNNVAVKMNCDDITLYRFGRSIQFKNDNCKIISEVPYRYIYSPFNELIKEM